MDGRRYPSCCSSAVPVSLHLEDSKFFFLAWRVLLDYCSFIWIFLARQIISSLFAGWRCYYCNLTPISWTLFTLLSLGVCSPPAFAKYSGLVGKAIVSFLEDTIVLPPSSSVEIPPCSGNKNLGRVRLIICVFLGDVVIMIAAICLLHFVALSRVASSVSLDWMVF